MSDISMLGLPSTGVWTIILLIYAYIASTLPVTMLLQPRDFINSHQLIIAMVLLIGGVIFAAFGNSNFEIVAPAIQAHPADAPSLWPFLFITIACGAISGFHSLVSSGTSAKQVRSEEDSLFVGYGSMLMEGALATLVIIAVAAGIGLGYKGQVGIEAWSAHYSSWAAAKGLGSKVNAFVIGAANMINTLGIPRGIAITIMGVFVASFAGTTLDTATRIQRYVVTELFTGFKVNIFKNRFFSTLVVVVTAGFLAFTKAPDGSIAGGKGALLLWPLFGAVNQSLAALALIIISLYLKRKGGLKWLISGIPALFMIVMTLWATIENQFNYIAGNNNLLKIVNGLVIIIVLWVIIESLMQFFRTKEET